MIFLTTRLTNKVIFLEMQRAETTKKNDAVTLRQFHRQYFTYIPHFLHIALKLSTYSPQISTYSPQISTYSPRTRAICNYIAPVRGYM